MAEPKTASSITHDEGAGGTEIDGYESYGLVKSRFDELSIPRTAWVFRRVVLVAASVYTGYVCEGFELGGGGAIVANAGFIKQFGTGNGAGVRALDPTWYYNVGQIVTFTYISWFADKYGRKASFYLAWVWLVVGVVLLNVAKTPSVWALAKLFNGAGIGVLQITCQVYIMEISPNRIRGGIIILSGVWCVTRGIIGSVMMQQLNKHYPDNYIIAMRILLGPVGIMIFLWAWIPESPWFHARNGNKDKALKAMKQLYGGIEGYNFEEEYGIIERTIEHEKNVLQEAPKFIHIFKGLNLKRTLTVGVAAISQQLGGLAIIFTYSTYFFSLAGLADPFLGTVILK
ncbi:general substrate transporter [Phaeosphaeriaceae sp. PMI808]|nr:general substrate transporter [Phaeosphaeriaceae sp. PMI808]